MQGLPHPAQPVHGRRHRHLDRTRPGQGPRLRAASARRLPQCGTRESEWTDDEGDYQEAYVATTHKCFGCEEIAARQSEIPEGKAGAGMKVLLLPASVIAAQQVLEEMTAR